MPAKDPLKPQPDRTPRQPADRKRVALTGEWELLWWCKTFGVDEQALRTAVAEAGDDAEAVRRHLRTQSQP